MREVPIDPIAIDVGRLVQRSVASLYAHLVTRPTGRAVRLAIETRLQGAGTRWLSLIDLSEVTVLDFSCADEVVAKLLMRYLDADAQEAFFVFRGVREPHRDPIEVVLERQGLAAVAETSPGRFELVGSRAAPEDSAWRVVEERGMLSPDELPRHLPDPGDRAALERLVTRRLVFRSTESGRYHALSRLVEHLLDP